MPCAGVLPPLLWRRSVCAGRRSGAQGLRGPPSTARAILLHCQWFLLCRTLYQVPICAEHARRLCHAKGCKPVCAPRSTNIHLINTLGVAGYDLGPCIECWCRDPQKAAATSYFGCTACCTPLNCNSSRASEPASVYYLQYNITYRQPAQCHYSLPSLPLLCPLARSSSCLHTGFPLVNRQRETTHKDPPAPQMCMPQPEGHSCAGPNICYS